MSCSDGPRRHTADEAAGSAIYECGYNSCGCNLKLSEVRSGSFRAPASVTILSQASSNPERSRVARHGRGHIWPGGGMAIPSGN